MEQKWVTQIAVKNPGVGASCKKERIAIGHNSFEPQQLNGSHDDFNNEVSEENFQACQAYGVSMNDGSSTTERRRIIFPLARRNFSK